MEEGGDNEGSGNVECYSYWRNYLLPVLESFPEPPSKLRILVPECGESTMSKELYDAGYTQITNLDRSRDVIRKMLTLHITLKTMRWRVGDLIERKKRDGTFDVVIDKGAMDALTSSEDLYLHKVMNILEVGGKFVGFVNCNSKVISLLLRLFCIGYKTTFHGLVENNHATMIVVEKVVHDLPYLISEYDHLKDVNGFLFKAILEENSRRKNLLDDMSLSLSDIESGVMGNPNIISVDRCFLIEWVGKEVCKSGTDYDVLVLDVVPPKHSYSWDIFFVPKLTTKLLVLSDDEKQNVSSHAQAPRLYVVMLDELQETFSTKELKCDLQPLFQKLAPAGDENPSYRCVRISEDKLLTALEKEYKENEANFSEDVLNDNIVEPLLSSSDECLVLAPLSPPQVEGFLSTKCPYSLDAILFPIKRACTEPCTSYAVDLGSLGQFHVERNNATTSHFLVDENYELSLTAWLAQTPERWSSVYEEWNDLSVRTKCKVDQVLGWNSSRPTEECCLVISGLIAAVCKYHSQGKVHGNLGNTDSYLMSHQRVSCGGVSQDVVHVLLDHPELCKVRGASISSDMGELRCIIFDVILEGRELPRLWADLEDLILKSAQCNMLDSPDVVQQQQVERRIIQNHPSCWIWWRRYDYFETLWMWVHQDKFATTKDQVKFLIKKAQIDGSLGWKECVPVDTPLHRVLLYDSFDDDVYDLYRFLRIVCVHIYDSPRTGHVHYITEDTDDVYCKNQFVEVLITECFPGFLLNIFRILETSNMKI